MRSAVSTIIALLLFASFAQADPWADEVVSVTYGAGAGYGQGEVFPSNILGPPDPTAAPSAPASTEEEVLSLGSGGEIILAFRDGGILNGDGVDFTIFENPFIVGNGPAIFREVALVAVSQDGEQWVVFPYDAETLEGLAGVTPTQGDADPLNPLLSGGDSFDLEMVGLETATYIRITDAADLVSDNGDSFDLDAVAVIHGEGSWNDDVPEHHTSQPQAIALRCWPNPFNAQVTVRIGSSSPVELTLYDMMGRLQLREQVAGGNWTWQSAHAPSGTYLLQVTDPSGHRATHRLVLVR